MRAPRLTAAVALALGVRAAAAAGAPAKVLVWPAPGQDPAEVERAVAEAGFAVVRFAPIGERLAAAAERERARAEQALDQVERGLAASREAYLDQRYDDMLLALAALEQPLDLLGRPEHRAVLWEVEFQLGLAYGARRWTGDPE